MLKGIQKANRSALRMFAVRTRKHGSPRFTSVRRWVRKSLGRRRQCEDLSHFASSHFLPLSQILFNWQYFSFPSHSVCFFVFAFFIFWGIFKMMRRFFVIIAPPHGPHGRQTYMFPRFLRSPSEKPRYSQGFCNRDAENLSFI